MRSRSPIISSCTTKTTRYSFEMYVQEIRINIRFPCKLSVSWNYGQGIIRGTKIVPLVNGVAKFNQNLILNLDLKFDQEQQKYQCNKSALEISLITDSGTSMAGIVTLNFQKIIDGRSKDVYEIERCPDKSASIKMKILKRFLGQKDMLQVNHLMNPQRGAGNSTRSQSIVNQQRVGSIGASQLLKQEISTLKTRASQYEIRYRTQKSQNIRLNEIMTSKQQIYISLKTQIKRKQIQIQSISRSLEEYKIDYAKIKIDNDLLKKQKDKHESMFQNLDRISHDRITKLQFECSSTLKKLEKLIKENQRLKKQRDLILLPAKSTTLISPNNISESIYNQLKKQKEDIQRQLKQSRQNSEKQIKELKKIQAEKQEEISEIKEKYESINRKLQKIQDNRMVQLQKASQKMLQLQKSKSHVNLQLNVLKKQRSRKDLKQQGHHQQIKNIERQLSQQTVNNMRLAQTLSELQSEKTLIQRDLERHKLDTRMAQQQKGKFEKEVEHLKYQIDNLNQLVFSKNKQIKQISGSSKGLQEVYKNKQKSLQEQYNKFKLQFQAQMQEVRKSEEAKYIALTEVLIKKQKSISQVGFKEQRLQATIQKLQEEIVRLNQQYKQKIENSKVHEQQIKHDCNENSKQRNQYQHQLIERIKHLEVEIHSLNQALRMAKENQFRFLEREQDNRLQLQQLKQMYSSANIQVLELKQELSEYRDKVEEGRRIESQMNSQISTTETRYSQIISQFKDKILQLEGQKTKLKNLLRQKQKTSHHSMTACKQENQELRDELAKREAEIKRMVDEHRQAVNKQKMHSDDLQLEIDRVNNEITRLNSEIGRNKVHIQQLEWEIKNQKESIKQLNREKDELESLKNSMQEMNQELQESKSKQVSILVVKDKQIKSWRIKFQEAENQLKQIQLLMRRISIVSSEVYEIVLRIGGGNRQQSTSQYERIMLIRKGLFLIETNLLRQTGRVNQCQKLMSEIQILRAEIDRLNVQKNEMKIRQTEYKRSESQLRRQLKQVIQQNQQFMRQLSNSSQNSKIDNSAILINQINQMKQNQEQTKLQYKNTVEKYERAIFQTKKQGQDNCQRIKKQLTGINKSLQLSIQKLQHDVFTLQLENQKLGQLGRKDQQIKRLTNKVHQLQRQMTDNSQNSVVYKQQQIRLSNVSRLEQSTISKYEKQISSRNIQIERLNNRLKDISHQLRDKDVQLEKLKLSTQSLKQQFTNQRMMLQQQKSSSSDNQIKLRLQIDKLKNENSFIKKLHDETKGRLLDLQASNVNSLQNEMRAREQNSRQFQQSKVVMNEDIFALNQKIQELTWELQQMTLSKDHQIMTMQQQIYSINSKENVRILNQSQFIQKIKSLQNQRNHLIGQVEQMNRRVMAQNQSLSKFERIVRDQEGSIRTAMENQKKYLDKIKDLQYRQNSKYD